MSNQHLGALWCSRLAFSTPRPNTASVCCHYSHVEKQHVSFYSFKDVARLSIGNNLTLTDEDVNKLQATKSNEQCEHCFLGANYNNLSFVIQLQGTVGHSFPNGET